jgi:trimeric autotransporter adhesin
MAKNFFNGKVIFDNQVAKFDMTLMASENIDFPANVIKDLNYLAADVVYEFDLSFDIATIRQGELQKMARMGHIQAAKDFTAAEALAAETARAGIQSALDAQEAKQESERAAMDLAYKAADATLTAGLSAEQARAEAAEVANAAELTAQGILIGGMGDDIINNKAFSDAAEAANAAGLAQELLDRAAAVNGVTVSLATEAATARAAEVALGGRIDNVIHNIDPAALDSLSEVVAAFQGADSTLNGALTALTTKHDSEIVDVRSEFATADTAAAAFSLAARNAIIAQHGVDDGIALADRSAIRTEFAAADASAAAFNLAARQAIITQHGVDDGAAANARAGIQSALDAQEAKQESERAAMDLAYKAADATLTAGLAAEQLRAEAAELVLTNGLTAEADGRIAADVDAAAFNLAARNAIITQHGVDDAAAAAARNAIQADVDANESASSSSFAAASAARGVIAAGLATEQTERIAGDASTLSSAKSYTDDEISAMQISMQALLDAEIAATNADFLSADAARVGLAGQIGVEKGRIDAILLASTADKDSFAEIVALVNSVDTTNDTAFAGHVVAYNTKMDQLDAVDVAATADRSVIRSEFAAADASALAASVLAASTEQAARVAAEGLIQADVDQNEADADAAIADEVAARVAGDVAEAAARASAVTAEEGARVAGDAALQTSLTSEVARATAAENALQNNVSAMFDGKTTVHSINNAVAFASIVMPSGYAFYVVSNSGASAIATLPVLGANFKMTLSFAAAGTEAMEFQAPAGMVIDGEADGKITLHPGSSVTFLENAGVYYMV